MDSYSTLLERIRAPQPSLQRFAVISIFDKIRSDDQHSAAAATALAHCLHSNAAAVVDQAVREVCRLVKDGKMRAFEGLLELQAALEGRKHPRFGNVFVKGIGFVCRFEFRRNPSWGFELAESHPFVKVLSSQEEVQPELIQQVILFIAQNRPLGFARSLKFLRPFLMFSVLRIPFSTSSASFMSQLMSSMASLSCSFPSEGMLIIKILAGCLKYFSCKNAEEFKYLIHSAEYLVDASTWILKQAAATNMPIDELQVCGLELIETLLSLSSNLLHPFGGSERVIELSKQLLLIQKELGLRYVPDCVSIVTSLSFILAEAELVHEQLSALKLSLLLLEWKNDTEYGGGQVSCGLNDELLFIFPVINLLSSPSKSVKAAAVDLLSNLERLLAEFVTSKEPLTSIPVGFPSVSKPELITCRLLHHLCSKGQSSLPKSYVLELVTVGSSESGSGNSQHNLWLSHLRKYSLMIAGRQKSALIPQHLDLSTEMPLLLSTIISVLVVHQTLGSLAVDTLAVVGMLDPKIGVSMLLSILFYSKIFCDSSSKSYDILLKLLEMIPSLASHPIMVPLVIQSILPMLHKDAQPVLYATAVRLLCKTWEFTDRVFEYLQGILQPLKFSEFVAERNICISMAASVRDVCKKNPDRGVDLILSVSACIESHDHTVKALGFESIAHLCEADAVDFYTAWDVILKYGMDYSLHPNVVHSLCNFLRWGAMDAEAYPEASMSVIQLLWEIGTSRYSSSETTWIKARSSAFQSLTHFEVGHIRKSIPDFSKSNLKSLVSEDNHEVLRAMESLEVKIITFEHIIRRRLIKEKRVIVNKVEKLLEVFPQVMFSSEERHGARELPGAALISLAFNPKDVRGQGTPKEMLKLHVSYENALTEIAGSLQLSRNILVALLSLQSWKSFMHRWMRAIIMLPDSKVSSPSMVDKGLTTADDILKRLCAIAEESIPRSAENIALAIGALCTIFPPSAHAVTSTASKFLLNWLFQFEHEHRQWTAAISLGLLSSFLHATDLKQKFQIITGLLEVAANSKSTLVKGSCGVGLGFASQGLLARVDSGDDANSDEGPIGLRETTLLGYTIHSLCSMICQFCPSSFESLQSLCRICPVCTEDIHIEDTAGLSGDNDINLEEDIWGVAGLVLGLADCVVALYRAGAYNAVLKIKDMLVSWIPYFNSSYQDVTVSFQKPDLPLSVGSCLALPTVVAFCQRTELMGDEVDPLVEGYRKLISELLNIKNCGIYQQSLLMASCIGAGNLISCILNEGVHSLKVDDVKSILELMRTTYSKPYPPAVHLGGMFGVVNALGAGAGTLSHVYPQRSSLQAGHDAKESSYIRGPLLSSAACEPLCTSLMQEMFLVAQHPKDLQIQRYAAWAVSFLRYRWWSKEFQSMNALKTGATESKPSSHSFAEDSTVWQLCVWLVDLNTSEMASNTHVNTVTTVLRCLSKAPRLPSLDWGAIIRRCMKYEDQVSSKLNPNVVLEEGALREECLLFSLAHANQVIPLLFFVDEVSDISRFRTLELNLQSSLLLHLAYIVKIFSVSRLEKLFDDMFYYFSSSTYKSYDQDCQCILRTSFWRGLCHSLSEFSTEAPDYMSGVERCMDLLFHLLPAPCKEASFLKRTDSENEWLEAMKCLSKAPEDWLMDFLQVPEMNMVQGSDFIEGVKRISARARLVVIGGIPLHELGKLKHQMLNTNSDGIWWALIEVVAALQYAEGSIKRQWLLDVVEISCITKYPSKVLQFLGLLSSSYCKYMPLLLLDRAAILSDLPITLPSLLSDSSWRTTAEPLVSNLWKSMERICAWAMQLAAENVSALASIDESESNMAIFLARVMHSTCVSLKEFLPFEKQLRLTNMALP